jgi:hypothetical protein
VKYSNVKSGHANVTVLFRPVDVDSRGPRISCQQPILESVTFPHIVPFATMSELPDRDACGKRMDGVKYELHYSTPLPHYSTTSLLHYLTTPLLHYSITPP